MSLSQYSSILQQVSLKELLLWLERVTAKIVLSLRLEHVTAIRKLLERTSLILLACCWPQITCLTCSSWWPCFKDPTSCWCLCRKKCEDQGSRRTCRNQTVYSCYCLIYFTLHYTKLTNTTIHPKERSKTLEHQPASKYVYRQDISMNKSLFE